MIGQRGCSTKVRYYSETQVQDALDLMKAREPHKVMHAYPCGDHWHVGTLNLKLKPKSP